MKKLFFLFVCVFVLACTKEKTTISPVESSKSDRLIFKDIKEFFETSRTLSKVLSHTDLQLWAQEKCHSTLLEDPDTTLSNYPPSLRTILNKDSEFQVGDSIVWFHMGNLYTYEKNATYLKDLKSNPESFKRSGYFTSKLVSSLAKGQVNLNGYYGSVISFNWSQTQYQPCGGSMTYGVGTRKWVAELRDVTGFYNNDYWESTLSLVLKLEWYNGKWHEASEQRNVSYSINGTIWFHNDANTTTFSPLYTSGSLTCANGNPVSYNLWIPEADMYDYSMGTYVFWTVALSGQSTQHVLGDPTNSGDPMTQYFNW